MVYEVKIKETVIAICYVEADTEEEAREKASEGDHTNYKELESEFEEVLKIEIAK
jgi:hypothetical protein